MKKKKVFLSSIILLVILFFLKSSIIKEFDILIADLIFLFWNPLVINLASIVATITEPIYLILLSLTLFIVLIKINQKDKAIISIIILFSGIVFSYILKLIFKIPRPSFDNLLHTTFYSYPSLHATASMLFFGLLILLFKNKIKSKIFRILFVLINILVILLIGFSRILLNVHWFSDILAGYCIGIYFLYIFLDNLKKE